MYIGATASLCSFIYTLLLSVVYFNKVKLKNDENAIYGTMLFANAIGLILEFFVYLFAIIPNITNDIIPQIMERFYFVYLFTWLYLFVVYIFITSNESKENKYKFIKNKLFVGINIVIYLIISALLVLLPVEHIKNASGTYSEGLAPIIIVIVAVLSVLLSILFVVINRNKMETKKKLPLYTLILCIVVLIGLRFLVPEVLFVSTAFSFVTILTYFTIENPDIKIVKELKYSKAIAEKSKNSTMKILNEMSNELKTSLDELTYIGYKNIDKNNLEEINKEVKDLQKLSVKLADKITGAIDIAKLDSEQYVVNNQKYDTIDFINDLEYMLYYKKGNKKIKLIVESSDNINKVLFGDQDKIKQLVLYLFDYLINYIKRGTITLKIDSINTKSMSRMKFCFYLKEKLPKEYKKYDEFKGITYLDGNSLDYEIINKLTQLLNCKIEVRETNDNFSEIVLMVDQKALPEYNIDNPKNISKSVRYFDLSDKRILFVDDDRTKIKEMIKLLKPYRCDIDICNSRKEFLNLLSSNKTYDLALIDDIIPEIENISDEEFVKRVKNLTSSANKASEYKLPLVILITNNKKNLQQVYLDNGFSDYIIKPATRENINDIFKKYLK